MLKLKKILSVILSCTLIMTFFSSCGKEPEVVLEDADGWYSIWATAAQPADAEVIPTNPGLRGNTCRQVIRTSLGGDKIKLTFSNEYGDIPLVIESVHIAKLYSVGNPEINTETDTVITFGGNESVTIEAGKRAVSDEIAFSFEAFDNLAVSMKVGDYTGGTITCHKSSNTTSWISTGDHVCDEYLSGFKVASSWYYLVGAETWAPSGTRTIVAIGDSITDGVGASYNLYKSWPDQLDKMLKNNPLTKNLSLVNMGISGNTLYGEWNDPVIKRMERDVFSVPGVRYCILSIGINDIGGSQADISDEMIKNYQEIIKLCHERGIKVYGCTLTPVKGNFYYSELHEKIRLKVNDFILSPDSGFDGVIDFSAAIARDDDSAQMRDDCVCSWQDYLHPGDTGYEELAKAAYTVLSVYHTEDEIKR